MTVTISGTTGISLVQDSTITSAKIVDGTITPADTQVGALPSMVRVHTANGYGSTNTKIRRFTTTVTNQGSDITYADSASLGASFTINTNGVYAISYSDNFSAAAESGISLNTSVPTTAVQSIPLAELLSHATCPAADRGVVTQFTGYLASSSIIRPHTDGSAAGTRPVIFSIVRVA